MKAVKTITAKEAIERLEYLCANSEQCEHGVREKLWKWKIIGAEADKIINTLIAQRYIDNSRFARQYCRQKLLINHWGKKKIALMLAAKRINRNIITEALDEIDSDQYGEALLTAARSKARQIKEGNTYEGRTKLYRHLVSRGFESQLISSIIRNPAVALWDF